MHLTSLTLRTRGGISALLAATNSRTVVLVSLVCDNDFVRLLFDRVSLAYPRNKTILVTPQTTRVK